MRQFFLALGLGLGLILTGCALDKASEPKQTVPRILFVLGMDSFNDGQHTLDPIAVIDKGTYLNPFDAGDQNIPPGSEFEKKYLSPNATYTILYGSKNAGKTTVINRQPEAESCSPGFVTFSRVESKIPTSDFLVGNPDLHMAIASNWQPRNNANSFKMAINDDDKKILTALAKEAFQKNGVSDEKLEKIKLLGIQKSDVWHDEKPILVGTFEISSASASEGEHENLFIIAHLGEKGFETMQAEYKATTERTPVFVDSVDTNDDGVDELILENQYYESVDYSILKFDDAKNEWKQVYQGGGNGC